MINNKSTQVQWFCNIYFILRFLINIKSHRIGKGASIYPKSQNKDAIKPSWLRLSCKGPKQPILWVGLPQYLRVRSCATTLGFLWIWGKLISCRSISTHLASCFRVAFPAPWIFWRFGRSQSHPWKEAFSGASRQKCIRQTTGRPPENSALKTEEFQDIYTTTWRLHECKFL